MEKLIEFLVNPHKLLSLLYIAAASALVTFCLKQHTSFKDAFMTFVGSIILGTLAGYLLMDMMGRGAKVVTAICGMFGSIVYRKAEKAAPTELIKRFLGGKNNNSNDGAE